MRVNLLFKAEDFLWRLNRTTDPEKKTSVFVRVFWTACGIIGGGLFFGSFGFLAMPFVAGWSWTSAVGSFILSHWAGEMLLDVPNYWDRSMMHLWLIGQRLKGKSAEAAMKEQAAAMNAAHAEEPQAV